MSRRTKRRKRERAEQQQQRNAWAGWLQLQWDALHKAISGLPDDEPKKISLLQRLGKRPTKEQTK